MEKIKQHSKLAKLFVGFFIVLVGSVWLAKNLEFIQEPYISYIWNWKALLIALGFLIMFSKKRPNGGGILILVGAIFLTKQILEMNAIYTIDTFKIILPLVVILIGISIMFKKFTRHHAHCNFKEKSYSYDILEEVNVFGGGKSNFHSQNFKGGSTVSVFGGSEIDFNGSQLAPGDHILESVSVFGGSVIKVPKDWFVRVEVVGIMGGFVDKRTEPNKGQDSGRTLIIKGVAIFGGGELKN
ncbi:MAG: hypothetical protein IPO21_00660 [Bacteroidales bacterium]|nr:hypothetical protein [Bacteroidales bacterium]